MVEIRHVSGDHGGLEQRILDTLDGHAIEVGHPFEPQRFGIEATVDGGFAGGLSGFHIYGWLYIRFFAVKPEHRGAGLGRRLMAEAEALARAAGCRGIAIDTFGFQAAGFYTALGFEEMARLPAADPSETRIYLTKHLAGPEAPG